MATLPTYIPPQPSTAIASYDWTNLEDASGVVGYDAFTTTASGSVITNLSSQTLYTSEIENETDYSIDGYNTWEKGADVDIDLTTYNLPQNIRGTGYIRFFSYLTVVSNGLHFFWRARLRKVSGGTETEIAFAETEKLEEGAGTFSGSYILPITIPLTHFKKGDNLRLTMEGWGNGRGNPGTTTGKMVFGTDPQNQDGTYIAPSVVTTQTTSTKLWIPYKIKN